MLLIDVVRRWGLGILGVALLIVGIILLIRGYTAPSGWTAYAPLSGETYSPPQQGITTGWILTGVGVVITAAWGILSVSAVRKRPSADDGKDDAGSLPD
ncbi:hypothetical protein [Glaciihabitans sp. dw_435]|uniref:hypothetical protein n=1 Tax=Glaciihabitans sp. dw_435 TaxID=2720081 RepID=UPI001BD56A4C|nr:hypothetical protein [Glaciihabitans sp. dw_435]